ncbi:hypothetical protein SCHPADRAFT_870069 [Schizopora paradoxa]|uniref:DUF6533 domain-containing protein n=1 Tax=Schizopora paradoxa TaxID=27342 RepID=A0A0H2RWU0_9AGAM|nr:hypothetical protein SCHPADRAFT_870069 [Schizopora paradoxa]
MSHGVDGVLQAAVGHAGDVLVKRTLVADAVSNMIFVKYYALASATLLYFDFFVTFPDEIRRFWRSRFTVATLFFVLNRYVPLVGYVLILLSLFNPPWTIDKFAPFPGSMNTFSQAIISRMFLFILTRSVITTVVLVLRTYALYGQKYWVLLITSLAGTVNIGISAVGVLLDPGLRYGWIATFSFDFLIFCLTIGKTCVLSRGRGGSSRSLVALVMRDGKHTLI